MTHHVSFDLTFRENPHKGTFIVIEGVDGAGKTSQVQKVIEALQKEGIDAITSKEPTDMVIGKFIREEVLSGKTKVPPIALQYLFNADRSMHLEKIENLLKEGKTVIMDRYFWSSVAYALADLEWLPDMYLAAFSVLSCYNQFIVPDLTIYLDVSLPVAIERIKKSHKHLEIYDHEHKIKRILKGYEFLLEKFPESFTKVKADGSFEEVTADIVRYSKAALQKKA